MNDQSKCENKKCCCNCINQKTLMRHPSNSNFGKGDISEELGFVCELKFDSVFEKLTPLNPPLVHPNKSTYTFFDHKHGLCEYYSYICENT